MAIELTIENVTTRVGKDATVALTAKASAGETIDDVTVKGLPQVAELTAGARQADGSWKVPLADLANVSVRFNAVPARPVNIEVVAAGTAADGTAISASKRAQIDVKPPAWKGTPVVSAVLLLMFTAVIFFIWRTLYEDAQDILTHDWAVTWQQPEDVLLSPAPITFWHDRADQTLHHRGSINAELKLQLLNLAYATDPPAQASRQAEEPAPLGNGVSEAAESDGNGRRDPRLASYVAAIDRLAYESQGLLGRYFLYLLALAGLSGMLGTQIRAFDAFIYRSTAKKDLDIGVWWSWYVLRPFLGFLLGLMAVLLIEARLFVPTTDTTPSGTAWWMALAMLVGFAANDFAKRLRLVGQALFGKEK